MIICNKCRRSILESYPPVIKSEKNDKKDAFSVPMKRTSIVSMPLLVTANNTRYADVDLCNVCMTKLNLALDKVRFDFINEKLEESEEKEVNKND